MSSSTDGTPSRPRRAAAEVAKGRYSTLLDIGDADSSSSETSVSKAKKDKGKQKEKDFEDDGEGDHEAEEEDELDDNSDNDVVMGEDLEDDDDEPRTKKRRGPKAKATLQVKQIGTLRAMQAPSMNIEDAEMFGKAMFRGSVNTKATEHKNIIACGSPVVQAKIRIKKTPWPADGQATTESITKEENESPRAKAEKWLSEVFKPYSRHLSDYGWKPSSEEVELPNLEPSQLFTQNDLQERRQRAMAASGAEEKDARLSRRGASLDLMDVEPIDPALDGETTGDAEESDEIEITHGGDSDLRTSTIPPYDSVRPSNLDPESNVHLFNTGGHNYSVDMCPRGLNVEGPEFFAVSVSWQKYPKTTYGSRTGKMPGMIQIWSMTPGQGVKLELVLHTDAGAAFQVQWRPADEPDKKRLGLLAATCADGCLSFFDVPLPEALRAQQDIAHDDPIHIHASPILAFDLIETTPVCLEWASGDRIAAGCANGFIAVWSFDQALQDKDTTPTHYYHVHESIITGIAWYMHPKMTLLGEWDMKSPPQHILSCTILGALVLSDIDDPTANGELRLGTTALGTPAHSIAYSKQANIIVLQDEGHQLSMIYLAFPKMGRSQRLGGMPSSIPALATSDYHPFVAAGSFDGVVRIFNPLKVGWGRRGEYRVYHTLFRLLNVQSAGSAQSGVDAADGVTNRSTSARKYRMLDFFIPALDTKAPLLLLDSPRAVAVTSVSWSKSLNRGYLLVSVVAGGLGRIEWIGSQSAVSTETTVA